MESLHFLVCRLDFNSAIVCSVFILKVAGAKSSLMWRLIGLSAVMLVTGYFGEAIFVPSGVMGSNFKCYLFCNSLLYLVEVPKVTIQFNLGIYSILIILFF
jgi:hypothetical protein